MIVRVDRAGQASLDNPEDCKKFHVEASGGDVEAVGRAVGSPAGGSGEAPPDHVWVPIAWVRSQAAGRVGDGWAGDFDAMVGYARSKGWLNEAGDAIAAHIEWS